MTRKKKIGLGILGFIIIVGMAGGNDESKVVKEPEKTIEVTKKEPEKTEEPTKKLEEVVEEKEEAEVTNPEEVVEPISQPEPVSIEAQIAVLEQGMGDIMEVGYSEELKAFTLLPTDESLIQEISMINSGQSVYIDGWKGVVESQKNLSKSIASINPDAALVVLNPLNPELVLLSSYNGVTLYDFTDDM